MLRSAGEQEPRCGQQGHAAASGCCAGQDRDDEPAIGGRTANGRRWRTRFHAAAWRGGPGPGSDHQISPKEQSEYLKAAACIRSHGIPNFPDPTFSGGGVHVSHKGLDLNSSQARKAEEACQSLIPGGLHGNH